MQIAEHPKHNPFPKNMDLEQKFHYLGTGKVTVGKFSRIRSNDFVDFFLPRIRGMNFMLNSRKFKHPGYRTPDQAFCAGMVLQDRFRMEK